MADLRNKVAIVARGERRVELGQIAAVIGIGSDAPALVTGDDIHVAGGRQLV